MGLFLKNRACGLILWGWLGFFNCSMSFSPLVYLQTSYPQLIYIPFLRNTALKSKAVKLYFKIHITKNIGKNLFLFTSVYFVSMGTSWQKASDAE